jgi:hypothetical protein
MLPTFKNELAESGMRVTLPTAAVNGGGKLSTSTNELAESGTSGYNTNIQPNVNAGVQNILGDFNTSPYLTKAGRADHGLVVDMAAAQGKDQGSGINQTGNGAGAKGVAATSEEATASLQEQAKGKKAGDTVSAVYMENGQVKVYTASVNESGIGLVSTRNATPAEKAVLQGNTESRPNVSNGTGAKGIQNNTVALPQNRLDVDGVEGEGNTFSKGSTIPAEILKTKPKYSPIANKWLDNGGQITIENGDWKYTNAQGTSVTYENGYPNFKGSGHVKQEVDIGGFRNRPSDFRHADQIAPNGPKSSDSTWHHNEDGKTLQEVNFRIHKQFTHKGGFSIKKKGE